MPLVEHISSSENATDVMTKVLYGQRRKYLVSNILYDIINIGISDTIMGAAMR